MRTFQSLPHPWHLRLSSVHSRLRYLSLPRLWLAGWTTPEPHEYYPGPPLIVPATGAVAGLSDLSQPPQLHSGNSWHASPAAVHTLLAQTTFLAYIRAAYPVS